MNNGDDIHNLLKTLGHDAGLYQDLAKYNASRAAVRRAAMGRTTDPGPSAAAVPAMPELLPSASEVPRVLRLGPQAQPQTGPSSLSSILNRLASPNDPVPAHGSGHGPAPARPPAVAPTPEPTRLDRLFGRLATRTSGPLGR
jgi:hypothetical protein